MTTGERMKTRRKEIGLSAERVAEILGVSPATIYRYENGDIEKIPGDRLEPIATALQTTPQFLMGWAEFPFQSGNIYSVKNISPMPEMKKIPLLGTIACGAPILAVENIDDYIEIPKHIKADFALTCHGDSMIGARIVDGDLVYIRAQPDVDNGQIAAVLIDNEATLKRVYKYPNTLVLRAENPNFRELVYQNQELEEIRILGLAVAFSSAVK
ncbi:MAG: helix-turn-helix domain-containing protein [Oscillospiraceae bacterium]|nr:helix-turn-helix domain-containing protein [Oscillospiraceae bacterium]